MTSEHHFTETRRFKVMRTVIGAANPLIKGLLVSRFAGPMAKRSSCSCASRRKSPEGLHDPGRLRA